MNYTSSTEIYTYSHTLSLHDARPISQPLHPPHAQPRIDDRCIVGPHAAGPGGVIARAADAMIGVDDLVVGLDARARVDLPDDEGREGGLGEHRADEAEQRHQIGRAHV